MAKARDLSDLNFDSVTNLRKLASGPGRLCQALEITRPRDNGKDLVSAKADLHVVDDGFPFGTVLVTPRIGITKSADMPLRYVLAGNAFVSTKVRL